MKGRRLALVALATLVQLAPLGVAAAPKNNNAVIASEPHTSVVRSRERSMFHITASTTNERCIAASCVYRPKPRHT